MRPPFESSTFLSPAAQARAETKAHLLLRLRARGLRDLTLLRAMESAPREHFVGPAHADLALRDVAVPLPCGQTMESPSTLAHMLTVLAPQPNHRILEIGAGSGYSACVLSLIGISVLSFECFERLALEARARLEFLEIDNVDLVWGDGLDISPSSGLFDRILVHGALAMPPPGLLGALDHGGVLVAVRRLGGADELVRYSRGEDETIESAAFGACRAQNLLHGLFRQA